MEQQKVTSNAMEQSLGSDNKEIAKPKLINTSGKIIDKDTINAFISYGLKFTPLPLSNLIESITGMQDFCQELCHFAENPITEDNSVVKPESTLCPMRNYNLIFDTHTHFC